MARPIDTRPRAGARAAQWLWPFAVALVTALVFWPSLQGQFLNWDDQRNFLHNEAYRGLSREHLEWMFTTFHMGPYQPLSWLSLGIDHALWGMEPLGYHRTNVLLHALNAAVLYLVLLELVRNEVASAVGALFFALHPLRVESVAWITERRDVLSGFFFLLAVLAYVRGGRGRAIAILSFALSLLSKASGMMLPFVLLVLDRYPLSRRGVRDKWPFFALAAAAAVVALYGQHHEDTMRGLERHPLETRVAQSVYGLAFYTWKTFVPVGLSPLYELDERFVPASAPCAAALLLVTAISVAAFALRRRVPALGASWLSYALLVAPVLGLVQSGPQIVADRYSYLPCLPWAALVAALVARLVTSGSGKLSPWRAGLASLPIVALGVLTWRQIPVWHDSRALWRHALAHDPESFLAHANLGFAFDENGEIGSAIEQYRHALRRRPGEIRTRHALGLALAKQHDYPAAIVEWRQIIALEPQHVEALYSIGLASARLGRTTDAIAYYRQALAIDPGYLPARNALREITKK